MEHETMFDNEYLFDSEGHLTDDGLNALQNDRLDELGRLEAAEHLTFCDYCLARYTALIESAPEKLRQPMRDLIPQVQNLMRLRSFRIMTNRYVSVAAAVLIAFGIWQFGILSLPESAAKRDPLAEPTRPSISASIGGALDKCSGGLSKMFDGLRLSVTGGLDQLSDLRTNPPKTGGTPAEGE